jgi:hypothetical protein
MNYNGLLAEFGLFPTLSTVARFLGERPFVTCHRLQNGEFKLSAQYRQMQQSSQL